ncbi:MAG: class I SAM-dependent methyltransferase [Calditrichaceae bacterium]|nr:class I SAM-dependent methyltransferase [Calditrichaceae bacterium]MBN2710719.1 class I SAM-dependent methyltransferase [Calditrichaceae bacterium]RQV92748.1 MAG: class I SAM-dependent methyltransferase [Calditrichota bacterium]
MKTNPWLDIPYSDYENHMDDPKVGQLKVLSAMTRDMLNKYKPRSLFLLGCSTGNGLEHIDCRYTKRVYCVDINKSYLQVLEQRFNSSIENLYLIHLDIQNQCLPSVKTDLIFGSLILEYVDIKHAINNIIPAVTANTTLIFILQKTVNTGFVTKTKYQSLESLSSISREVDEKELENELNFYNISLVHRTETVLNPTKKFVTLTYQAEN